MKIEKLRELNKDLQVRTRKQLSEDLKKYNKSKIKNKKITKTKNLKYKTYSQKLKNVKWKEKREEILKRDNYTCVKCKDSNHILHVHHLFYLKKHEPWEYENECLITLCEKCHNEIHNKKK